MDFFGDAFSFLDDAASSVGDFFSNAADSIGNAFSGGTTDYTSAIGPNADGTMLPASVVGADNAGGLGKYLGAGISGISKSLAGGLGSAGNQARQLSREFSLPGQSRSSVMGYDQDKNAGKGQGLRSEDPRNVSAYWHSLMQTFAYGQK